MQAGCGRCGVRTLQGSGRPGFRLAKRELPYSECSETMSSGDSCAYNCAGWVLHFLNVIDLCIGVMMILGGVFFLFRWGLVSEA